MDDFVVRAVRADEHEACLDLWCTVWPGAGSPAYFRRYFEGDVEWLPYYTQVGVLNGKIVSAVQICKRTVACGDLRLTMGGIANVTTLPEYRGRGYNTQCLQSAVAVMEADAMDFSLLFTGINDYYARQGYDTLPRAWVSGTVRSNRVPIQPAVIARPATAADLPAIQACYDAYNRSRPIAVKRSAAYWRDWMNIHPYNVPGGLMVAVRAEGEVCGYVQTGVFKSAIAYSADALGMRVTEYGAKVGLSPQEENEVALSLLRSVVEDVLEQGQASELRVDIARTPSIEYALDVLLTERIEHVNTSGMVRLLHRDNLLRSVMMGRNEHWIEAGRPSGRLGFNTPYAPIRLDATGTFLRVQTVEQEETQSEILSQSTLFGLLFGMLSPEQATEDESLHPLVLALFPPQAAVYYGADGF